MTAYHLKIIVFTSFSQAETATTGTLIDRMQSNSQIAALAGSINVWLLI